MEIPSGWGVTGGGPVADGTAVGHIEGFMTVADPAFYDCNSRVDFDPLDGSHIKLLDATTSTSSKVPGYDSDGNGKPDVIEDFNPANGLPDGVDRYPAFLNDVLPGTHKARYFGWTEAAGINDLYVNVIVRELAPGGPHDVVTIVNSPNSPPESSAPLFCAPQSMTLVLQGSTGAQALFTNPSSSGSYEFTAQLVSEFDHDNDGVSNGLDLCPFTANANQLDADQDYVGDACDQDALANTDVDLDGFNNGFDNCIFVANPSQADADYDDIGDACDPNSTAPDGANYYLTCSDPVGIGVADPGAAACGSGGVGGVAELPVADSERAAPVDHSDGADSAGSLTFGLLAGAGVVVVALGVVMWLARARLREKIAW